MPRSSYDWTEERLRFLRENVGRMTYSQLAKALDCPTRDIVVGKVHRMRDAEAHAGLPKPEPQPPVCSAETPGDPAQLAGKAGVFASAEAVATLARLYSEGRTFTAIGQHFGVSDVYVYTLTKRFGWSRAVVRRGKAPPAVRTGSPRSTWDEARVAALREYVEQGLSMERIAARLGATRDAVRGQTRKHGIERPLRRVAARPESVGVVPLPEVADVAPVERTDGVVTVMQLRLGVCRWPTHQVAEDADGLTYRFCGCATGGVARYCPDHAKRSRAKAKDREPRQVVKWSRFGNPVVRSAA